MDDFEKAIRVIFTQDPSITPAVREQATNYCDAIKARPDCWSFCWEQFSQRDCMEVRFWCLQALPPTVVKISVDQRRDLRSRVLTWMRDRAPAVQEDVVLRNKIALVYVALLKTDYPCDWPSAWTDLIALLEKGPNLVDLFLRVLTTFDQEVVSDEVPRSPEERQRSHVIKHAMREGDVLRLAECWFAILGTFRQSAPQLVMECLKTIGAFVVWVEILTIANEKFLGAIYGLISEGGPAAGEACDCLGAVISKKMPAGKKVQMLQQLQIMRCLGEHCIHRGSADLQLIEKEAELFNTVGEVVLEAYVELRVMTDSESARLAQAAWDFVKEVMVFVFWFFSHQEYQIGDSVEAFLTAFFARLKSFVRGGEGDLRLDEPGPCHTVDLDQVRPILQQTLQLIIQRLAYPDWFQHGDPNYEDDERHITFLEFRRSLTKIFKRIFLVDEEMGYMFIQASISQLTQGFASVRPMEVEAVLHLYKETGEIVKDVSQHLQANGALATSFVRLLECEALLNVDHWLVQLALIDVYVRYGKIFVVHPEFVPTYGQRVLQGFIGPRGIHSQDRRVVTRACYMFSRFVKMLKKQIAPFAADIYEALKDLLAVQFIPSSLLPVQASGGGATAPPASTASVLVKGALKAEDQACLFEALAGLVSALPEEQMRPALQKLLEGPASNLAELATEAAQGRIAADTQGCACWVARSIEAIGTISKGFSQQQTCAVPDWEAILQVVARTLDLRSGAFNSDIGLWRANLFLCRRMVEVLGDHFLNPLDALLPFLYASNQADLLELTTFAHQIVCQYQKKTQSLLQKWLHVVFSRPFNVWRQMPEDSEQLKRERFELGSALLLLLKESAQRCPITLLEPMLLQGSSSSYGQDLVSFLLQGLQDPRELKALLYATSSWSALLDVAAGPGSNPEALGALPLAQLLRQLLWSVARMDYADVSSQKVLGEAAAILRSLTSTRLLPEALAGQAMEALQQALVAALPGLSSDVAPRQLCEALAKDAPLKDIRVAIQQCAADWHRDMATRRG